MMDKDTQTRVMLSSRLPERFKVIKNSGWNGIGSYLLKALLVFLGIIVANLISLKLYFQFFK